MDGRGFHKVIGSVSFWWTENREGKLKRGRWASNLEEGRGFLGWLGWVGGGLINDNYSSPSATIKMNPISRGALVGFLWFWGGLERWVWGGLGL